MADVGLAVGGGGAVVKDVGGVALPLLHALFKNAVLFPELCRFLRSRSTKFRFVETSLYMLMAAILSLVCAHRN